MSNWLCIAFAIIFKVYDKFSYPGLNLLTQAIVLLRQLAERHHKIVFIEALVLDADPPGWSLVLILLCFNFANENVIEICICKCSKRLQLT